VKKGKSTLKSWLEKGLSIIGMIASLALGSLPLLLASMTACLFLYIVDGKYRMLREEGSRPSNYDFSFGGEPVLPTESVKAGLLHSLTTNEEC